MIVIVELLVDSSTSSKCILSLHNFLVFHMGPMSDLLASQGSIICTQAQLSKIKLLEMVTIF